MRPRARKAVVTAIALMAALLGFGITSPAASAATPPTVSGCTPQTNGNPALVNDQDGRWIQMYLLYRCSTGKDYLIVGTLYQDPDSQGGEEVGKAVGSGAATSPYALGVSYTNCDATTSHSFHVQYKIDIADTVRYYTTSKVALACYFN